VILCIYCDEFQAVGPAGTCDHCEPMPDAPRDQRGPEPTGEPAPSIVYRITHLPTGRVYVGVHRIDGDPFEDDGYMGSGEHLRRALAKYPAEEWKRDVLAVLPTKEAAFELEAGLVGPEQVASPMYFNLCVGGRGVVGLADESKAKIRAANRARQSDPEFKARQAEMYRKRSEDPAFRESIAAAARCPDRRAKLSASIKAKFANDPEYKARVAAIAHNATWRAANAAACRAPERRAKISAANRVRFSDPAERAKLVDRSRTPEARAANRARSIARMATMTPEERRELTRPATVASQTPEARALAAESNRARCADMTPEERTAMTAAAVKASCAPEVVARRAATRKLRARAARERREREAALIVLALVAAAAAR